MNGYVDDHTFKGIRHRNWGDDLNYFFLGKLTRRPVVFYHNFKLAKWFHLKNYLCIGTLLDGELYKNGKTIVWGSGCSGAERMMTIPNRVLSVRGPLSRDYLCRLNVECPEFYGDPALLLPLFYHSEKTKRYRLGIIPHVIDQNHPVIEMIRKNHSEEILIIDLAHYKKWTDVIDQICSCEKILSSSLHGIIVSDAYGIPNHWIELSGMISGGHFKFLDYLASVDRRLETPWILNSFDDISFISTMCADKSVIKKRQQELLKTVPFHIYYSNASN